MTVFVLTPLTIVSGIWGAVLGLWLLIPLLRGRQLARATRRVPVWAGVAAVEVATLATGQALLLIVAATMATGFACAEIVRLTGRWRLGVAGCALGLILSAVAIRWPPILLFSAIAVIWLFSRRDADGVSFPLVAGALYPPLLTPFWSTSHGDAALPLVVGTLVLIHLADISAGFFGKLGGPKAFPRLSPNKTWWGLTGSAAVVTLLSTWMLPDVAAVGRAAASLLGVLMWVTSVIGDLVASKIKRLLGVKDFSALLGPHGGVADRLDSLVVALPLLAVLGPALS